MRQLFHARTRLLSGLVLLLFAVGCLGYSTTNSVNTAEAAEPAGKSGARSWPMFGGTVQRNLANPEETGLPDNWSIQEGKTKNVKWSAKLGNKALGGPIVANGRVFVGTNRPHDYQDEEDKGVLMCFRESDGQFLWQAVHDKLKGDTSGAQSYGIVSSPCVDGDRIYYVNNRWEVICADAAGDGSKAKILWNLDMIKELKVNPDGIQGSLSICSPLMVEDLLFVVTANGVNHTGKVPNPDAPSFIAVDKSSGKVVWQDHSPGANIMDGTWGNPAAAKVDGKWHVYFPGGDGWLYAFEAKTGELVWKFDCNPKKAVFKPGGRHRAATRRRQRRGPFVVHRYHQTAEESRQGFVSGWRQFRSQSRRQQRLRVGLALRRPRPSQAGGRWPGIHFRP